MVPGQDPAETLMLFEQKLANLIGPAGLPAIGTLGKVEFVCNFVFDEEGQPAHYEGSELFWDTSDINEGPNGRVMLLDERGNSWEAVFEEPEDQ